MSIQFPVFTVMPATPFAVDLPGSSGAVAVLRWYNYTPYTLLLRWTGGSSIIPPEFRDRTNMATGWDGHVDVTPVQDLSNVALPTSSALYLVGYGPNESIPGSDPAAMTRTIGGQVASLANQVVASAMGVVVTTAATILSYPVPAGAAGHLLRVGGLVDVNGSGGLEKSTFQVEWSDADLGLSTTTNMSALARGTSVLSVFDGATAHSHDVYAVVERLLHVQGGSTVTVTYTVNSGGGPAGDLVSAFIEELV